MELAVLEPSGWELFAPLIRLFESGDYEEGADRTQALLAGNPSPGAAVYYDTACFESRAGGPTRRSSIYGGRLS